MLTKIEKDTLMISFDVYVIDLEILKLKEAIEPIIQQLPETVNKVLLDFSNVQAIDVKGFNYLIELYINCQKKQCSLRIIHCPLFIQKQLELFKLDCLFCVGENQ